MQGTQTLSFARSTIGRKVIMAVTGLVGIGFLLGHMYGNLKIFLGAEYFNHYAEGLRDLGAPLLGHTHFLWIFRLVLIASVVLHVWAAYSLTRQAWAARPDDYAVKRTIEANYATKLMRWGGVLIFVFITYHLMHFTLGILVHPNFTPGDAYQNVIIGFSWAPAAIFYIIAVFTLGIHLYHGGWSLMQTLGILAPRYDTLVRRLALLLGITVAVGFSIVPFAVLTGFVK